MNTQSTQIGRTVTMNEAPTRIATSSAITTVSASGIQPSSPAQSLGTELTVLVLDVSSSMGERFDTGKTKLDAAKNAATVFTLTKRGISPQDEVGIVLFNDAATTALPLTPVLNGKATIIRSIQNMTAAGGTDIDAGLRAADSQLAWHRGGSQRRIVLLSDGHGGHPLRTASELKRKGVIIEVVGIGAAPGDVDEPLLRATASTIQGEVLYRFIRDAKGLMDGFTHLATRVQTRVQSTALRP